MRFAGYMLFSPFLLFPVVLFIPGGWLVLYHFIMIVLFSKKVAKPWEYLLDAWKDWGESDFVRAIIISLLVVGWILYSLLMISLTGNLLLGTVAGILGSVTTFPSLYYLTGGSKSQ